MSINGFKPAVQTPNDDGATEDLICRKGFAVTARSRGYDHKDAFEPAQGATAPPSDADEFGAWLKYEGSLPAPTDQAKAVSEEELPTSWYKYETKPMASLTAAELPRAKVLLRLTEPIEPAVADAAAPVAPPSAAETALAEEPSHGALSGREDTVTESETGSEAENFDPLNLPSIQTETVIGGSVVVAESAEPGDATTQESSAEASAEAHGPARHEPEATITGAVSASSDTVAAPELPEPISVLDPATTLAMVPVPEPSEPETQQARREAPESTEPAAELEQDVPATCTLESAAALSSELEIEQAPPAISTIEPAEIPPPGPEPQQAAPAVLTLALAEIPAPEPEPEQVTSAVSTLELAEVPAPEPEPEQSVPAASAQEIAKILASEPEAEQATPTASALASAEISASEPEPEQAAFTASTQELVEICASEREPTTAAISELQPAGFPAPEPAAAVGDISGPITLESPGSAPVSEDPTEPGGAAPKTQQTTKKAKLARLAAMLERMLAAKQSGGDTLQQGDARLEVAEALLDTPETESIEPPQSISASAEMPAQIEIADIAILEHADERVPIEQPASPSPKESPSEPEAVSPDVAEIDGSAEESSSYAALPGLSLAPTPLNDNEIAQATLAQILDTAEPNASDTGLVLPVAPGTDMPAEQMAAAAPEALPGISTASVVALATPPGISGVVVQLPPGIPPAEAAATETEPWPEPPQEDAAPVELPASLGVDSTVPVWLACELAMQGCEPPVDQIAEADMACDTAREPATESSAPIEVTPLPDEPSLGQSTGTSAAIQSGDAPDEPRLETAALTEPAATPPEPTAEPPIPVEPAPIAAHALEDIPVETIPTTAPVPPDPAEVEKATRASLASGLADIIHDVLNTTSFATKATIQARGFAERVSEMPEPLDPPPDPGEMADGTLPHPVAIRSRLGRIERVIGIASLVMTVVVGYFAFSLWENHDAVAVQAPAIVAGATPSSSDSWGERTRDIARDLNSYATNASGARNRR